jgi:hypothetical protein
MPEPGGPTHFHVMRPASDNGTDLYFGDDYNYVLQRPAAYGGAPAYGVEIGANDNNGGAQQVWRFGTEGTTFFPDGTNFGNINGVGTMGFAANPGSAFTIDTTGGSWQFGTDGNLTLPSGGIIDEAAGIKLTPAGGANAGQALVIYPTAGAEGDHIHMAAYGATTELYLGTDNHYVKLVNGGNVQIQAHDLVSNAAVWTFGVDGDLTLPSQLLFPEGTTLYNNGMTVSANVGYAIRAFGNTGGADLQWFGNSSSMGTTLWNAVRLNSPEAADAGTIVLSAGQFVASKNWEFDATGNLKLPETGYLQVGRGIVAGFASSPAPIISGFSSISAENFRFQGNGVNILSTVTGTYGNANVSTFLASLGSNTISTSGNVTAGKFIGDGSSLSNVTISLAGNIVGTQPNVTLVAGSYSTVFSNTGAATFPGSISASNFIGSGSGLTEVALKTTGSWTVTTGTGTYSFTVPASGTYQLWVDCNIPNGILVWNATATVSNTNVPVVGAQYAWVYNGGGTPIDFVSIPNQFVGTANTIVRSNTAPSATTNRFDFGISNTSGSSQTAYWGYVRID